MINKLLEEDDEEIYLYVQNLINKNINNTLIQNNNSNNMLIQNITFNNCNIVLNNLSQSEIPDDLFEKIYEEITSFLSNNSPNAFKRVIVGMFRVIHCNSLMPKNHNIYVSNKRGNNVLSFSVYENDCWQTQEPINLIWRQIDRFRDYLLNSSNTPPNLRRAVYQFPWEQLVERISAQNKMINASLEEVYSHQKLIRKTFTKSIENKYRNEHQGHQDGKLGEFNTGSKEEVIYEHKRNK